MDTENEDQLEHRRDELRRIVYGMPGEPAPEVAAELAAVEAELVVRHRGDESDASAHRDHADPDHPAPTGRAGAWAETVEPLQPAVPAAAVAAEPPVSNGPDVPNGPYALNGPNGPEASDSGARRRPTRSRLLAAAVAVLVLVGGGIALLGPVRDALSPPHGLGVFERDQTPEELDRSDEVATGAGLQTSAIASLRWLGRAFGHDFWVFRDDRRVCLLSRREFFFGWVETCASIEVFAAHGLTRRIPADDIRDGARPRRIGPGDVVVVTWGPESTEVEWTVEP